MHLCFFRSNAEINFAQQKLFCVHVEHKGTQFHHWHVCVCVFVFQYFTNVKYLLIFSLPEGFVVTLTTAAVCCQIVTVDGLHNKHHCRTFLSVLWQVSRWREGYLACKKYCLNSIPGSPGQHSGSMLSLSQEHCYWSDASLKPEGKAAHTTITVPALSWRYAVSSREHCHPSVLWCCSLGNRKGIRPEKLLPQNSRDFFLGWGELA